MARSGGSVQSGVHHIGEVAERVGLSLRTIRHYEEVGLVLPSGRSAGNFRLYTDEDIERLHFVKRLKPLDFTLSQIRDLLEARRRLSRDIEDDERAEILDRLKAYAEAAAARCDRLRDELESAEILASSLRREAAGDRRPTRMSQ